jgi:hypothetical protein
LTFLIYLKTLNILCSKNIIFEVYNMANDDQGPCFIVIGIIIIVMSFVLFFNFFFIIIGAGFIMAGCCFSSQQQKRATQSTQTTTYQPAPVAPQPTQTAPVAEPEPPAPKVNNLEKHKFCPYCGSSASDNVCDNCGAKID